MLNEQVALVTGGSRGIGRSVAARLEKAGATVAICGRQPQLSETAQQYFADSGVEPTYWQCDVANPQDVVALADNLLDKYKRLDILVNNAGVTADNLLLRMKMEEWQRVLEVNLTGTFVCTKAVAKAMVKQRRGAIVNVTSVIGVMGNSGQANYAASKAGIIGFTKSIAKELASRNIRVNAVAPGFIETDMTADLPEATRASLLENIPLARLGTANDVASIVEFLVSDQAGYITGQVLHVDGGLVM